MKKKFTWFLILFLTNGILSYSKEEPHFPEIDSIKSYFERIQNSNSDRQKENINDELITYFITFLEKPQSFTASFDSLQYVSVLRSDDNLLNIFTWNLYFEDGKFKYFGFLQYKTKDKILVYFLNDKKYKSDETDEEITRNYLSNMEWYGAIYYEIVTKKWNSETYYTLIGWDGANFLINRKIVEILRFNKHNLPVFGGKIFQYNKTFKNRFVFEYADRATMLLRYNPQQNMIVMDHLAPPEEKYRNLYQYYGPDLSYDALIFRNGKWILELDIDAELAIPYKKNQKVNTIKKHGINTDF
ncbi:MAG: hypothetical protein LBQ22_10330 [Bacteroidales bacterium]|jgi:hypothetical protein|nr:hypothetical protein [Bacteroidales bacterium]